MSDKLEKKETEINEIKIFKADQRKGYAFGFRTDPSDSKTHIRINMPHGKPFVTIKNGEIEGITARNKEGKRLSSTEIAELILSQNDKTMGTNASGYYEKKQYGNKWFFDFSPELEDFFNKNNIPIPEDRKSIGDRMKDLALGNLESQGLIQRGTGTESNLSDGEKALHAAKEKARDKLLLELQEKLAKMESEKTQLEEKLKAKKQTNKENTKPQKQTNKKKEPAIK